MSKVIESVDNHELSTMDSKKKLSIWLHVFLIWTCAKVLLFPSYRSTDFEVHRHWKALTRHSPIDQWYWYDDTPHTLDYPPGFAFFEYILANNPITEYLIKHGFLDDECLQLMPHNELMEPSNACIAFLRSTVVASDAILWIGAWLLSSQVSSSSTVFALIVLHPALLWLDHVHFQYNGMLLGILMISLSALLAANQTEKYFHTLHLLSSISFAVLLTLKHLYLTLSLWYFAYLLRRYCFVKRQKTEVFSPSRFVMLATVTGSTLLLPFVPFLMTTNPVSQVQRMMKRLFPFGRGLVHDYWAGNIWALYMGLAKIFGMFGVKFPQMEPSKVALILLVALLPGAWAADKAARSKSNRLILTSIAYSALASFQTAYHVHEKAIVTCLIPLTALLDDDLLWMATGFGLLGLFPLLFQPTELALKVVSFVEYISILYRIISSKKNGSRSWLCGLSVLLWGITMICYELLPLRVYGKFEFIPLACTSLCTATGLVLCWMILLYRMMSLPQVDDAKT